VSDIRTDLLNALTYCRECAEDNFCPLCGRDSVDIKERGHRDDCLITKYAGAESVADDRDARITALATALRAEIYEHDSEFSSGERLAVRRMRLELCK